MTNPNNSQEKKVSVVVPTLNEVKNIRSCLEAIKNQTYKNVEIIIADGYSSDGIDKIARRYGRVVYTKKKGPGAARNAAVKKATGDIVAFTDADTIVPLDWVERIMQNFSDPKLVGVGRIQKPLEGRWIEYVTFTMFLNLFSRFRGFVGFYELSTTNCAYRKDIFLKAGGFDESMTMMEDTVLSLKVEKIGNT